MSEPLDTLLSLARKWDNRVRRRRRELFGTRPPLASDMRQMCLGEEGATRRCLEELVARMQDAGLIDTDDVEEALAPGAGQDRET